MIAKLRVDRLKKKVLLLKATPFYQMVFNHYFLCLGSEDTDNFFLPLALLRASTFRPLADAIRSRKPCLFLLFLLDGWNVLFMVYLLYSLLNILSNLSLGRTQKPGANIQSLFCWTNHIIDFFRIDFFTFASPAKGVLLHTSLNEKYRSCSTRI